MKINPKDLRVLSELVQRRVASENYVARTGIDTEWPYISHDALTAISEVSMLQLTFDRSIKRLLNKGLAEESFRRNPESNRIQRMYAASSEGVKVARMADLNIPNLERVYVFSGDTGRATRLENLNFVKEKLSEVAFVLPTLEYSQEEAAQIAGLLRICQEAVELPYPKMGLVRHVLAWLKMIPKIAPLVDEIEKAL